MSNGKAPVCPISRSQAVPGMPPLVIPNIPQALDLPTAMQALTVIQNVLIPYTVTPVVNNIGFPFGPLPAIRGNNGPNQDGGGGGKKQDWQETHRCYEIIRVVDPDDDLNHVDIPILRWLLYNDMNKFDMQLEYLLNR